MRITKLTPVNRMEQIAMGEKIIPESREEAFAQKARLVGSDLIVTLSADSGSPQVDKTFAEISTADAEGRNVRLIYNANRFSLSVCDEDKAQFTHMRWTSNSKARLHYVSILADDTIEEGMADFTPSSIPG